MRRTRSGAARVLIAAEAAIRRSIPAPTARGLCGPCVGMTQLERRFTTGGMGSNSHFAWQQSSGPNVRFGSKEADIGKVRLMSALPPKADILDVIPPNCPTSESDAPPVHYVGLAG